jgi:hypothetical protein
VAFGDPVGASLTASGKVVGPGAGAAICTIPAASLPAGFYSVQMLALYGAAAGVDFDVQLQVQGAAQFTLPIGGAVDTGTGGIAEVILKFNGLQNLSLNAIAGNGAGVYMGLLIATKIRL